MATRHILFTDDCNGTDDKVWVYRRRTETDGMCEDEDINLDATAAMDEDAAREVVARISGTVEVTIEL